MKSTYFQGNYAISGGAGFGKTSIIKELSRRGYTVIPEVTREFIEELIEVDSHLLPWKNREAYQNVLIPKRVNAYLEAQSKPAPRFADRGLLDEIAYMLKDNITPLGKHMDLILIPSYDKVFITPPWEKIYVQEGVRNVDFKEAFRVHKLIVDTYQKHGYDLIEIPKLSIEKRVDFILTNLT